MGALAETILRLDELSSSEEEALFQVLAGRRGKTPLPAQVKPEPPGDAASPEPQALPVTPESDWTVPVESDTVKIRGNPEFKRFVSSVSEATKPMPSGPGRKGIIHVRMNELIQAWGRVPSWIKDLLF